MPTKDAAYMARYHAAFWEKIDTIYDKEKILKSIEKGKSARQKNLSFTEVIRNEVNKHTLPMETMEIKYMQQNKGKGGFTHEEDKFLVPYSHCVFSFLWPHALACF